MLVYSLRNEKNVKIHLIILDCISNANNVSNNIYTDGCAKQLGKRAVGQTLALAVINSFLVIIALAAVPVLFEINSGEISPQSGMPNQPAPHYGMINQPGPQYQQQYAHSGYNAPVQYADAGYNAPVQYAHAGYNAPVQYAHSGYNAPVQYADAGYNAPVQYADAGYNAPVQYPGMSYSNYNPTYPIYY
jgi:hypothetical protein